MRRIYSIFALMCVINVLAGVGLVGTAVGTGRIDGDKARAVVDVLRGAEPEAPTVVEGDAEQSAPAQLASSESRIKELMEQQEVERLKTDKARVDLDHQRVLLDRAMMRLQQERREHQSLVERHKSKLETERAQELSESFLILVRTIGGMKPKNALGSLMERSDAEAARILHELPQRNRNIIMDACKAPEQQKWRDRMFDHMAKHHKQQAGGS